jgi:hypothetical protein
VNERGLAYVNSALETSARNEQGYPVFLMARDLLQECATAGEAAAVASETDAINYGSNFLLADAAGEAVVVERSVTRHAVRRSAVDGGVLFATNHNAAPALDDVLGGGEALLANSRERYERLAGLAASLRPSLRTLQELFCDHTRPGGFCQHGQGNLHTIGAFVAEAQARQLWVALGPPCENHFVSVPLKRRD